MLSLQEIAGSRYLLYRNLVDCGFAAGRAALAVDVLLGPEPADEVEPEHFGPSEEEWQDYIEWSDRLEPCVVGDEPDSVSDDDVMTVLGCAG